MITLCHACKFTFNFDTENTALVGLIKVQLTIGYQVLLLNNLKTNNIFNQ